MLEIAARRAPTIPEASWLKLLPDAVRFVFHGDAAARSAARASWGVDFPQAACRAAAHAERASLWLGPDEYLLLDFAANAADVTMKKLEESLGGVAHALVDVSHRQFAVEVGGPHAASILNGACPLDLALAGFPIGMCTRTVLAKADIVLWRTSPDTFHLEVWRSFAGYVTGILSEIAGEYYP